MTANPLEPLGEERHLQTSRSTPTWWMFGLVILALAAFALPACSRRKIKRKKPKPPTIESVNPPSGPETGGTAITIIGTRFAEDAQVDVNSQPALAVMV